MKKGDCYRAAVDVARELNEGEQVYKHVFVAHGQPIGTGPENENKRYNHAWVETVMQVEVPDGAPSEFDRLNGMEIRTVHDKSNGGDVVMPRDLYYHMGQIYSEDVDLYEWVDVEENLAYYLHYGPWDGSYPPYKLEELDDD